jgi:predicted CoA-binding protein
MSESTAGLIERFLATGPWAVVGASKDRTKYGNRVLRAYQAQGMTVFPVNPGADEIEGLVCYPDLLSLPEQVRGVSVIVPPERGTQVAEQAAEIGVDILWFQPGAESAEASARARQLGLAVIDDGSCFLVATGRTGS